MANELGISNPGKTATLRAPSEAIAKNPDFFTNRGDANWILRVKNADGTIQEFKPGTDWEVVSKFGAVRSAVVTKPDGTPEFDRPRYDEAPNINAVVWGTDKKTGEKKIAILSQARPHADNVFEDTDKPMPFYSIPMGFKEKIIGKDQMERFEHAGEAATREASEEAGAQVVLNISEPEYSSHYPNPTFVGTTSDVVFIEVDLDQIDKNKTDKKELIYSAEYVPLKQVLSDIKAGKTDKGYARMATTNSAILLYLVGLSEFQNAERNQKILTREGEMRRTFKEQDPVEYAKHMAVEAAITNPDKEAEILKKVNKYIDKQVKQTTTPEVIAQAEPSPTQADGLEATTEHPKPAESKKEIKGWRERLLKFFRRK